MIKLNPRQEENTLPRGDRGLQSIPVFLCVVLMNGFATVQIVWLYLATIPSYIHLDQFERGQAPTPFQHRILMLWLLRWVHGSPQAIQLAHTLSAMNAWFPNGMTPEDLLQAPVDIVCVVTAGLVARSLYKRASRTGLLTPFVYPLTLVMVTSTYVIYTMHRLRFVYDLPSLAFFSVGLYIIYNRLSLWFFIAVFLVATINRETTLFLLLLYLLADLHPGDASVDLASGPLKWTWPSRSKLLVAGCLLLYWVAWHMWIAARFSGNPSESKPRVWLNIGILLWPTSWTQIMAVFAFTGPLIVLLRKRIRDRTLRAWQWAVPLWIVFMIKYGILIEVRIFGELIPYIACVAALIAEEQIVIAHPKLKGQAGSDREIMPSDVT